MLAAQTQSPPTEVRKPTSVGLCSVPEFANLCPEGANRFGVSAASPLGYPDSYVELLKIWH